MRIIEITALSNGAHRNQSGFVGAVPEGWAIFPTDIEAPNFPFGTVTVEDGVVTSWSPGTMPEPEPEPDPTPSVEDLTIDLLADHEERICLLELTTM